MGERDGSESAKPDQVVKQAATVRPVAQARVGVDVAASAEVDTGCSPALGQTLRCVPAAVGVIGAGRDRGGEGQGRLREGAAPRVQCRGEGRAMQIGWCDEQGASDPIGMPGAAGPGVDQVAAQTMSNEGHGLGLRQYHVFQARNPVAAAWQIPVGLLDHGVAVKRRPATLPVIVAGA